MDKDKVTLDLLLHAPLTAVWQAWTDGNMILQWFGSDPDGRGVKAMLDVRPGGYFEVTFQNSDGAEHNCFGVYKEVQAPKLLTFTWEWKNEPGAESFVTVLLAPEGNFTRMHFEHANLGTASAHDYSPGWRSTFEKLERLLA